MNLHWRFKVRHFSSGNRIPVLKEPRVAFFRIFEGFIGIDYEETAIADGAASKLTVEAGNTYAYVYTVTQPGAGTDKYELIDTSTFTAGTTDVSNYFTESSGTYTAATGTYDANTKYYAKYTVYTATYAVKVIKVASGS